MLKLSVNLNKVATLRNTRAVGYPAVTAAAEACIAAGAHGITVHPRPDERHIRRQDVFDLVPVVQSVEYNIEGNPFHNLVALAKEVCPTQVTLVPDSVGQSTSDHGWDLKQDGERLKPVITELKSYGCRVSLFMDAIPSNMKPAAQLGADRIELYTEPYAEAYHTPNREKVWQQFADSAKAAADCGLGVNAGHDLSLVNLAKFSEIPEIQEVSIGHAFIADSLWYGMEQTTKKYLAAIAAGRSKI